MSVILSRPGYASYPEMKVVMKVTRWADCHDCILILHSKAVSKARLETAVMLRVYIMNIYIPRTSMAGLKR